MGCLWVTLVLNRLNSEVAELLRTLLGGGDPDDLFFVVVEVAGVPRAFALRDEWGFHLRMGIISMKNGHLSFSVRKSVLRCTLSLAFFW